MYLNKTRNKNEIIIIVVIFFSMIAETQESALPSGPRFNEHIFVICNDTKYVYRESEPLSSTDKTLEKIEEKEVWGQDVRGSYEGVETLWSRCGFLTLEKWYELGTVTFEQHFSQNLTGTGSLERKNEVLSSYPSISLPKSDANDDEWTAFLQYSGPFLGINFEVGRWTDSNSRKNVSSKAGLEGGPIVFFRRNISDSSRHSNNAFVVSALTNPMAHSYAVYDPTQDEDAEDSLHGSRLGAFIAFGCMGSISTIPAGYTISTLIQHGQSIKHALSAWGSTLRQFHGPHGCGKKWKRGCTTSSSTTTAIAATAISIDDYSTGADASIGEAREVLNDGDYTTTHLGYSTDNGAFYYYQTEHGMDYEQTLLEVRRYMEHERVPVKHMLVDSYWYYKDERDAVTNWTARADIFPHGIRGLHDGLGGMPLIAHNRWWSDENVYARENGGHHEFVFDRETHFALPLAYDFWFQLLTQARQWGVWVYEQDWLYHQFNHTRALLSSATLGRDWLMQMGKAAADVGMKIQYSMPFPRHALQSLEIEAVTQIRGTDDYQPQHEDWKALGVTSMFAHAIGLRVNKDSFFSSRSSSYDRYSPPIEIYNRLHSAISALSMSTVAIGDRIGHVDRDVVMKTCREDGLLLQPDAPAMLIESAFFYRAGLLYAHFGDQVSAPQHKEGVNGEVWTTLSTLGSYEFWYILSLPIDPYDLTLRELWVNRFDDNLDFSPEHFSAPADSNNTYYAFEANSTRGTAAEMSRQVLVINEATSLRLSSASKLDFGMYTVAPELGNGMVFLGERDKWISVAKSRFENLDVQWCGTGSHGCGFTVTVKGSVGERVSLAWMDTMDKQVRFEEVLIPNTGVATFSAERARVTKELAYKLADE